LTDEFPVATPVNWQQGEEVIVVNSVSDDEASRRFDGFRETKPYLRFVKDPKT